MRKIVRRGRLSAAERYDRAETDVQRQSEIAARAQAAMTAGPRPSESSIAANDVVARRSDPGAEGLAISDVQLIRVGRLRIVVEEENVRVRAPLRNQIIEARDAQERRIPFDRRMAFEIGAGRREKEMIDRELQTESLIETGIEEQAVIVASRAA